MIQLYKECFPYNFYAVLTCPGYREERLHFFKMEINKAHLRHCLLYEFHKADNAHVATKNICDVYGADVINIRLTQRWFTKFRSGDVSLTDKPRTGRPPKSDDDILKVIIDSNSRLTSREIALKMGVNQTTVSRHLRRLRRTGMVSR